MDKFHQGVIKQGWITKSTNASLPAAEEWQKLPVTSQRRAWAAREGVMEGSQSFIWLMHPGPEFTLYVLPSLGQQRTKHCPSGHLFKPREHRFSNPPAPVAHRSTLLHLFTLTLSRRHRERTKQAFSGPIFLWVQTSRYSTDCHGPSHHPHHHHHHSASVRYVQGASQLCPKASQIWVPPDRQPEAWQSLLSTKGDKVAWVLIHHPPWDYPAAVRIAQNRESKQ